MRLTRDFMLERARARDASWNGRFLTGVLSTGIYCLPSCPARRPNEENVRFFFSEEEARRAGLRPCRRCRPDHFYRQHDPDLERVSVLVERIRRDPSACRDARGLAAAGAMGPTKLSQLFRRHFHTSPAAFLQRARIEAACHRLAGSQARVIEVALEVGYESLSAFHEAFRRATGLCPGDYRRLASGENEFTLALPRDFLPAPLLGFWGRDPESRCEKVDGRRLAKAVRLAGAPAVLVIEIEADSARCRVESAAVPTPEAMQAAHAIALRLLGLGCEVGPFVRRARNDAHLARLVRARKGLRIPSTADVFEGLTWAVIGQQVNLPFAFALRQRLAELAGDPLGGGLLAHPSAAEVARLDYRDLTRLQFSRRKAEYLIDTARLATAGELPLEELPRWPATTVERRLAGVRGLGRWSTAYIMMRACGFADCVPAGDSGLATALQRLFSLDHRPDADEVAERMNPYSPYRSLATFHLWTGLGGAA
jgi:AraC family transcriptional regulator, regulatory protein of adaptative response / DNA-3-methyladenine glycosylase II